ncbi:GNAT family N-acetyltransferase [Kitasatospora sp. NPDC056531]|uniref:GNAT family N-acetyltransferase n=1 Tax=Kitasatospora sp. NPDC056531 TaxID=3345856 RepID=UPI00367F80F4
MIALRELTPDDAAALQRIYSPESTRFLGRRPMDAAEARKAARDAAASAIQSPRSVYVLGLDLDGDLLGIIKLHLDRPVATLSYILRVDAWGKGHATEAVRRILALGFGHLGLPEIHAKHHPDNPASGRVLLKAGFAPTGEHAGFTTYAIRPPQAAGSMPRAVLMLGLIDIHAAFNRIIGRAGPAHTAGPAAVRSRARGPTTRSG